MKLLLISNSGSPLYEWCKEEMVKFLGNEATFISSATVGNPEEYFTTAKDILSPLGLNLKHLVLKQNPLEIIQKSKAFLVAGGNTYHLLYKLSQLHLLEAIKNKVLAGTCYLGLSAGANITGPNILTTNDWNVVKSKNFEGLNLVPFDINPHYTPPHDKTIFSGENRDERIQEYFTFNSNPVFAMEEKTMLEIEDNKIIVKGQGVLRVFRKDIETKVYEANSKFDISDL